MYSTLIFLLATVLVVNGGHSDAFLDSLKNEESPKPIVKGLEQVPTASDKLVKDCTTDDGKLGECVPTYMCKNSTNKDGINILSPRFGECSYLDICCLPAYKLSKPFDDKTVDTKPGGQKESNGIQNPDDSSGTNTLPKPSDDKTVDTKPGDNANLAAGGQKESNGIQNPDDSSGTNKPGTDDGLKQCNGGNQFTNIPGFDPAWRPGCGRRNKNGVGIKVNSKDNEAQFGEFPWMCAILTVEDVVNENLETNQFKVFKCGGSLIHPKVVLTAAHCVKDYKGKENSLKVRAGEWDTQTENEVLPYQERNVVQIIVHSKFRPDALHNDIALMFLDQEFNDVDNVGVVCLPPVDSSPPLARCLASGWGRDVFGKEGKYFVILKKIEMPIVEHGKCQEDLRKTRLGQIFELHESFTCAGGEAGKDTCTGDGGSPLVCPMPDNPNRYMQTGIVAWGIDCGKVDVPGVYVNVAHFREWIDNHMVYNSIELEAFQDPTVDC